MGNAKMKIWCVATLLTLGVTPLVQAQSLVDVAKQEQQRRSAVTHPSRVYTNADARPVTDAPPAPVTPTSAPLPQEQPTRQRDETQAPPISHKPVRREPVERTTNDNHLYLQQPIILLNPAVLLNMMRPHGGNESSNTNTPRQQAMANYMRDAGFAVGRPAAGSR